MKNNCPKCTTPLSGISPTCPSCGFIFPDAISSSATAVSLQMAWERPGTFGIVKSFFETLLYSLTNPRGFYTSGIRSPHVFMPWMYALIAGCWAMVFSLVWSSAFIHSATGILSSYGIEESGGTQSAVVGLIASPFIVSMNIFLAGVYVYVLLSLFCRGRKPGFAATTRVICYAAGPFLLSAVPVIGNIIAPFWALYMILTGESVLYRTGKLKIFFILFVPLVLLILFFLLAAAVLVIAGLSQFSNLKELYDIIR